MMHAKSLLLPLNTALIIIDVQKGFDDSKWGKRNNFFAEKNIAKLLSKWRKKGKPVFHIKNDSTETNSPLQPHLPGNEIKDLVKPKKDEPVIIKNVNSAFIGTDLQKRLKQQHINTLVFVGLTTDHCVSTTIRMGRNLGFTCYVVSDATATFERKGFNGKQYAASKIHELALVSLHGEFATVIDTENLIALIY